MRNSQFTKLENNAVKVKNNKVIIILYKVYERNSIDHLLTKF